MENDALCDQDQRIRKAAALLQLLGGSGGDRGTASPWTARAMLI